MGEGDGEEVVEDGEECTEKVREECVPVTEEVCTKHEVTECVERSEEECTKCEEIMEEVDVPCDRWRYAGYPFL